MADGWATKIFEPLDYKSIRMGNVVDNNSTASLTFSIV
jgi:hypothetical protein